MSATEGGRLAQRSDQLHAKVTELEAFVAEALRRGTRANEIKYIVDDSVEHSRRKATILQHKDSSLLLAAVEQAHEEICKLPEVTATNAEVMEELEHGVGSRGSSEYVNASVRSEAGLTTPGRERLLGSQQVASRPHAAAGEVPTPKTPANTPQLPTAAAEVVQSLRAFAQEVAEERQRRPGPSLRTLSMSLRRPAEKEKVVEYDFEAAKSPMASYYLTESDFNPFRPSASRQDSGEVLAHYSSGDYPITTDYALSSPRAAAAAARAARPNATQFVFDEASESTSGEEEGGAGGRGGGGPGSGAGSSGAATPPQAAPPQGALAGRTHCATAVPPGLNPLAVLEGHSELDNPTTPAANGDLPTPGQEEELLDEEGYHCGSITPPKHVLQRLAEGIRRLSI